MLLKLLFAVLLLFLFSNSVIASDEVACMEPTAAAISGLLPGMGKASLGKIGKYISMETASGEDDGGDYEAQIYHYSKYDIAVVRGIIDSITITSPEFLWANKIKLGMDRNKVAKKMKIAPVADDITSSHYVICSSAGDVYATFRYRDNKVTTIEIIIDRP